MKATLRNSICGLGIGVALALVGTSAFAQSRDTIIVGSSTVYPFSTVVAERFAKASGAATPKVESTGTGGGMKLFCGGVGTGHPDLTGASRQIKKSEFEQCQANGVKDIIEIQIGFDGIVLANSKKAPAMKLTTKDIYLALAKNVSCGRKFDARSQPLQDLEAGECLTARYQDRGIGPAARIRHPRCFRRIGDGSGL